MFRPVRKRHLASAAMLAGLLSAPPAAQALSYPPLFGTNEARSNNIAMFPKWRGTLDRYFEEARLPQDCLPGLMTQCLLRDWQTFLAGQEGQDPLAQLSAVNAEMNRRRYVLDPPNWGIPDYWATPLQFMEKNGDCEDYAIAKFMSLRALGWSNDSMRIVVLKDLNLQLMHAVLVVYHEGQALVLDNQIDHVMPAEKIRHYRPIYSLNEDSWWLHRS